jgi:hypothetical protein
MYAEQLLIFFPLQKVETWRRRRIAEDPVAADWIRRRKKVFGEDGRDRFYKTPFWP